MSSTLIGTPCGDGCPFERNTTPLTDKEVRSHLEMVLAIEGWIKDRGDHLHRVQLVKKVIQSGGSLKVDCMAFPKNLGTTEQLLVSLRPPCIGTGKVEFQKYNDVMCECHDQLNMRFREYVITGMCHLCQAWYIERDMEYLTQSPSATHH